MDKIKIQASGQKINFLTAGQGFPFVLLHGWGGSSASLEKIGQLLSKMGFQIFIPDLPGFGSSSLPEVWTTPNFADFIWLFTQKLNLKNFYLFGHSFGGRIALHLSRKHPENVLALILLSPSGIKKKKRLKRSCFWLLSKLGKLIFCLPPLSFLKETARKILYFFAGERDYYHAKGVMKKVFQQVNREDIAPLLPQIKTRTLLLWGKDDRMVETNLAPSFLKGLKNARLEVIPGGHDLPKKNPEKVVAIINEFLNAK